jgi:hypothetical protein
MKKKHFSSQFNVLFIGHNHDEARSIEHFHECTHETSERNSSCNKYNESADGNKLILSGRICFFPLYVYEYALQ